MKELDCEVVNDLLALYAEDMVSETTAAQIEKHIKACASCRETLRRMRAEMNISPAAAEPSKRMLRYMQGLRLWYLLCPLTALGLHYFSANTLLRWYVWGIGIFAAICVASQFLSGVTPYGIDWDQVMRSDSAAKQSRRTWGGYYVPPIWFALPALLTVAVLKLLPLIVRFITLDISPAIRSLPFVLAAVIALLSAINKHLPK